MALRLRISAPDDGSVNEVAARSLTSGRLTIGRSVGNDWTLVDPSRIISKFHCVVEGSGDSFRVIDNSSNGVFVNSADRPLGRGNSCVLHHGDQVKIGPYCIEVEITRAAEEAKELGVTGSSGEEPLENAALLFDNDRSIAAFAPQYRAGLIPTPAEPAKEDWLFSLDASPDKDGPARGLADLDGPIGIDDSFAPPVARLAGPGAAAVPRPAVAPPLAQGDAIPTNWNVSLPDGGRQGPAAVSAAEASAVPVPGPPSASPRAAMAADGSLLAAFLDGAGAGGLTGRVGDPAMTMHQLGEVFRIVVEGVIATLEARKTVKRELGVAATEFRPAENNPLKFTLGVEDTIATLLSGDERGYLPAPEAFQDAFADITRHQLAVLAGMQQAWADLLRRFDPEAIKSRVGNDAGVGALLISKKSRYWDAYVQLHAAVASDADNEYRSLFYRVFGEAYERYLAGRPSTVR